MPLIGFLNSASPVTYRFNADAFRDGLAQAGFVDGRNVRIEERWANADYNALPVLANELVAKGVVAIAATGDVASARAAQSASGTVPIVFTIGGDPVRFGLVASFNRPGGNITGIAFVPNQLGAKRVQLLHELVPKVARVGLLMNPDNPNVAAEQADLKDGAAKLGLQIVVHNARNAAEIDAAFAELVRAKVDAVIAATDPVMLDRREQIAALAERNALPGDLVHAPARNGGPADEYGPDIGWMYRQAGGYIGQILKGAKPADMPVMQSIRFELVLNLKTARRLGLTVSRLLSLLSTKWSSEPGLRREVVGGGRPSPRCKAPQNGHGRCCWNECRRDVFNQLEILYHSVHSSNIELHRGTSDDDSFVVGCGGVHFGRYLRRPGTGRLLRVGWRGRLRHGSDEHRRPTALIAGGAAPADSWAALPNCDGLRHDPGLDGRGQRRANVRSRYVQVRLNRCAGASSKTFRARRPQVDLSRDGLVLRAAASPPNNPATRWRRQRDRRFARVDRPK